MKILKRLTSIVLTAGFFASVFSGINVAAASSLISVGGWYETAYAEWSGESNESAAKAEYRITGTEAYTEVDEELVRSLDNGNGRVDIPGLEPNYYDLRITAGDGTVFNEQVKVVAYDRSGFAHYNNSGVGAYNDDGTLKSNADVLYVTNETKNTIKYGSYTGIGNILKNAGKISKPLAVRIIGKVDTQTRDSDGTKTTDKNNGIVAINGLTDTDMGNDSYFNMLDISGAKNITIEGIGTDAEIEKWGMMFKNASSGCEVRNLTFAKYPEDACSVEGSGYSSTKYFWFHHNTFYTGENKYDLTDEQDKHEGDGTMDLKRCGNVTVSYNQVINCHKTSLNGGSDSNEQYHITYHHNFFNGSSSRMPLTRHADIHTYNNYFLNASTACIDARASACVLSENNYFENSNNIYRITNNTSQGDPIIKAVGDYIDNSSFTDSELIFDDILRTEKYSVSSNKNKFANFDTDPSMFYYDEANGKSDVMYLTDAQTAKENALVYTGVLANDAQVIDITNITAPITTTTTTTTTTITTTTTETTTETTTTTTTEDTTTTAETTTETTTAEPVPIDNKYGDADNNGIVDAGDVAVVVQYILNGAPLGNDLEYADVNKDGKINSEDAAMILQNVLDKNYTLPRTK